MKENQSSPYLSAGFMLASTMLGHYCVKRQRANDTAAACSKTTTTSSEIIEQSPTTTTPVVISEKYVFTHKISHHLNSILLPSSPQLLPLLLIIVI